jgi:hypothetical protein
MRDRVHLLTLAVVMGLNCLLPAQDVQASTNQGDPPVYPSISAIRINPVKDRPAKIEGRVVRLIPPAPEAENEYFLKDDSGRSLRIISPGTLPELGANLVVEGMVDFIEVPEREVVLREIGRTPAGEPEPEAASQPTIKTQSDPSDTGEMPKSASSAQSNGMLIIMAIGAVVLLGAGGASALIFMRIGKAKKAPPAVSVAVPKVAEKEAEVPQPAGEQAPAAETPAQEVEEQPEAAEKAIVVEEAAVLSDREEVRGELLQTYYPLSGAEKSLPGRLEVISGEKELRELYFRLPKDSPKSTFTFGSGGTADFGHFLIGHETVSESHAKIVFSDGEFELINYAIENATRVNNRELQDGEKIRLAPGDVIEMGILEMVFHTEDEEEVVPQSPETAGSTASGEAGKGSATVKA